MSELFAYICTKQSVDTFIPAYTSNIDTLTRDISDAFYASQGGYLRVGQIAVFTVQRSVANHLLCDGSEVPKASFPELYEFIRDSEGAAADADHFKLPNFVNSPLTVAAAAATEVIEGGTVSSEASGSGTGVGGSVDYAVDSGGYYRPFDFWIPF